MLHDGAIRFLAQAAAATADKDFAKKSLNLNKAIQIIDHLWGSLDHEKGGEIAGNLSTIFAYMHKRLIFANFNDDVVAMEEVISHVRGLRESWAALDAQSKPAKATIKPQAQGGAAAREHLALAA